MVYVVQSKYPNYGWRDAAVHTTKSEALADLTAYRENEPEYLHRIYSRKA